MPGKRGGGITNPLLDPRTDGHGESGGGIVEEEGEEGEKGGTRGECRNPPTVRTIFLTAGGGGNQRESFMR